jgi:hypothetical protein
VPLLPLLLVPPPLLLLLLLVPPPRDMGCFKDPAAMGAIFQLKEENKTHELFNPPTSVFAKSTRESNESKNVLSLSV